MFLEERLLSKAIIWNWEASKNETWSFLRLFKSSIRLDGRNHSINIKQTKVLKLIILIVHFMFLSSYSINIVILSIKLINFISINKQNKPTYFSTWSNGPGIAYLALVGNRLTFWKQLWLHMGDWCDYFGVIVVFV